MHSTTPTAIETEVGVHMDSEVQVEVEVLKVLLDGEWTGLIAMVMSQDAVFVTPSTIMLGHVQTATPVETQKSMRLQQMQTMTMIRTKIK